MRASEFEFRNRFWIIGAAFWLGFFLCYRLDHANAAVALLRAFLGPEADSDSSRARDLLRLLFAAGALLVGAAALLRTWSEAYLHADIVHDGNLHSEALVADGPYRYVRNPLYLGTILMTMGIGLMGSWLGWFVLVGLMTLFQYRLISREEGELLKTQGEGYRAYCAAVPRLLPALRPQIPAAGNQPRWGQAFWGEIFFWIFFAGMAVFAWTLRVRSALWAIGGGLAFYILQNTLLKRRHKAAETGKQG
jgi:protein-S-isoprenylcysteine O-methyltransferase Ste14